MSAGRLGVADHPETAITLVERERTLLFRSLPLYLGPEEPLGA